MKFLKNLIYLFLFTASFPSGFIFCSDQYNDRFINHKNKQYGPFYRYKRSCVFIATQDNNPGLSQESKDATIKEAIYCALRDRCKMALFIKFADNGIVAINKYYNPDFK